MAERGARLVALAVLSVLLSHALLVSLLYQVFWLLAPLAATFALLCLAVTLAVAAAAYFIAKSGTLVEPPPREGGTPMLAALVATATLPLFFLTLVEVGAGTFYTASAALSLAAWVLARPRFRAKVEPVVNGLLTGTVMFIVALLFSALISVAPLELALTVASAEQLQLQPLLMLWVVALPEELWARVFLVSVLSRYFDVASAAFVSHLFFVWLHVPSRVLSNPLLSWYVILVIGVNSLILLYGYLKLAHHPLYAVVAHMTYNSLIYMLSMGVAGAVTTLVLIGVIALLLREKTLPVMEVWVGRG